MKPIISAKNSIRVSWFPLTVFLSFFLFYTSSFRAQAQPRGSTNYAVASEAFAPGHLHGSSANYTHDASAGLPAAGLSAFNGAVEYTARQGHVAQLVDVKTLVVTAAEDPAAEQSTVQLNAAVTFDDDTTLDAAVANGSTLWSVVSGPLDSIDGNGLATTQAVCVDTPASAQGRFGGVSDAVVFVVADSVFDNFCGYSGDGLDDTWQVTHFGMPPNANAAPGANPDRDPYDNLFEYLSGHDPNDTADYFSFLITSLAGNNVTLELSRIVPGTRYRIMQCDPDGGWIELTNFVTPSVINNHEVIDVAPAAPSKVYRAELEEE